MDLVVSPTVVAFNSQSAAHPQGMTPGQTIDALVMQLLDAVTVRVSVAGTVVDLPTPIPLVPGAIVRLAVRGHGTDTKFVIVGMSPRSPADVGQKTAPDAATSVTIASQQSAGEAAGASVDEAPAPNLIPEQTPKAQAIERAISADPTTALASAMRTSAARQVGLAPLFADVAEAFAAPQLPTPVRLVLAHMLALPRSFESGVSAADVQHSLKQSGILLETQLADHQTPFTLTPDLKVALLALRQVLHDWTERVPQLPPSAAADAAGITTTTPVPIKPPASSSAGANSAAVEHNTHSASQSVIATVKALPPPYRGAPTTGQQPMEASIEATAPLDTIRNTLVERTEGALARMTLLQSASLSDGAPSQTIGHESSPHWNFEVPFVAPGGTAVAHFEIARDGHKSSASDPKAAMWRANFSLDLEPIGPVHAQVAVAGNHTSVRLWAERTASATALRAATAELKQALHQANLESTEVLVRVGEPPRPVKPPAGRFVDRAS